MSLVSTAARGGGTSIVATLFDSLLGADAAAIDSGANGIAATSSHLLIVALLRTADAAVNGSIGLRFNNDSAANYDSQFVLGSNVTASAGPTNAGTSIAFGVHGAGGAASEASAIQILVPNYALTTFNKSCAITHGRSDTAAANMNAQLTYGGWRSTAAISRLSVTGLGANIIAGSRLTVFGLA